ncbi:hypothetical protein [Microbacterium murale]|uniref:Uncharacterized protein n=1 Tax=Microbacterium murale TaxID=1081040 RepID=A0ABU0P4J0_9MICO|nr:hypothetical protein [Microbacterium murale]MDQ0642245.1 hypothetical protein [Microbacterium murale]
MGLFNRKSMQQRQEDAMKMADDIGQGRGFVGKMTKAMMGSEFTESVQQATASMHQAQHVAGLRAAGVPTQTATVLTIQDTGQTINDNPHIVITLDVDGQQVALATLVSRLEIPRTGDQVLVMRDPQSGNLLYAGLAPRV